MLVRVFGQRVKNALPTKLLARLMCNRFIFFSQSWDEVDWILLKLSAELPKSNSKNSKKTKLGRDYIQLCNIDSGADNTLPILSAWISTTCIPMGQLCRLIQVTIEGCQCSHCSSSRKQQTTNNKWRKTVIFTVIFSCINAHPNVTTNVTLPNRHFFFFSTKESCFLCCFEHENLKICVTGMVHR